MTAQRGMWGLPCWNALSEAQQTRLMIVGNLPLGFVAEGSGCLRGAEVGIETAWDDKPGAPRFYCLDCAIEYLIAVDPHPPLGDTP